MFLAKLCLIRLGNKTLPIAMANPIKMVPMNNVGTPPTERITIPIVSNIKERKSVSSIPKRRAILGANGDNKAKETKNKIRLLGPLHRS